jgi:hypothetical protein
MPLIFAAVVAGMAPAVSGSGVLELPQAASIANTGAISNVLALPVGRVKVFIATFLITSWLVMNIDARDAKVTVLAPITKLCWKQTGRSIHQNTRGG